MSADEPQVAGPIRVESIGRTEVDLFICMECGATLMLVPHPLPGGRDALSIHKRSHESNDAPASTSGRRYGDA